MQGGLQCRENGTFGEIFKQKAFVMKLVGRCNCARFLQQVEWRGVAVARGLNHRLVLGAVFIRLEKDFVQLLANWLRALALRQCFGPVGDLQRDEFFLFDGGQGKLQNFQRSLFKPAFACAPEIVRCVEQTKQRCGLLLQRRRLGRVGAEVVPRQVSKRKFIVAGEFPGQLKLNVFAQFLACGHEL